MVIKTFLYSILLWFSTLVGAVGHDPKLSLGHYSYFSPIDDNLCLKYQIKEESITFKKISLKKIFSIYDGVSCLNQELELPENVTNNSALLFIGLLNQLGINTNNIVDGENLFFSNNTKYYCKRANCPQNIASFIDIEYFNGKGKVYDEFLIFYKNKTELNQMIITFSGQKILNIKSFVILNSK